MYLSSNQVSLASLVSVTLLFCLLFQLVAVSNACGGKGGKGGMGGKGGKGGKGGWGKGKGGGKTKAVMAVAATSPYGRGGLVLGSLVNHLGPKVVEGVRRIREHHHAKHENELHQVASSSAFSNSLSRLSPRQHPVQYQYTPPRVHIEDERFFSPVDSRVVQNIEAPSKSALLKRRTLIEYDYPQHAQQASFIMKPSQYAGLTSRPQGDSTSGQLPVRPLNDEASALVASPQRFPEESIYRAHRIDLDRLASRDGYF